MYLYLIKIQNWNIQSSNEQGGFALDTMELL